MTEALFLYNINIYKPREYFFRGVLPLTQREREILQFLQENPMISQQELADHMGITRSAAGVHISNLIKKGYIAGRGYVFRPAGYTLVVGGVNVDIGGSSFAPLIPGDSNPGHISVSLGGVGRNIAHNLALLGRDVRMLTAYGDDLYGEKITESCRRLGIDLRDALKVPDGSTSIYLYIAGSEGDMTLAMSDMEICRKITPAYLAEKKQVLQNARVVLMDANLSPDTMAYLVENSTAPVFADPVSAAKADKLLPFLSRVHTLKPNRAEAEKLTGIRIRTREDAAKAAEQLLSRGVQRVFLSLGAEGVYAAGKNEACFLPAYAGNMISTTGCGDAFTAALVWAWLEDFGLRESACAGIAAASIAMESRETVNPAMCAAGLQNRMKQILKSKKC